MKKLFIAYFIGWAIIIIGSLLYPTPKDCGTAFLCFDPWVVARWFWGIGFLLIIGIVWLVKKLIKK